MFINFKNHIILLFFFLILYNCQLQEPNNNHGILFLENRSNKLIINKSNTNDVLNIFGEPHSKSVNNINDWIYIERTLTKGKLHKLGQNVLKTSNVLLLSFDKYGVLKAKKLINKDNLNEIKFSKDDTENNLSQKSFIQKFLNSVKTRMYSNTKNK